MVLADAGLVALVLMPAAAGIALLCAGAFRGREPVGNSLIAEEGVGGRRTADGGGGAAAAITVAAITAALAVVVVTTDAGASAPFIGVDGGDLALSVDGMSRVLVPVVALVALAVMVFAAGEVHAARPRFFGLMLLFTAAMLVTVTATTLPTLLLAWEVMGAMSYALVGFAWRRPGKVGAGTTAFLTTRLGDLGLYVAAGAALAGTGSLALDDLAGADGGWRDVAAAGVLVAALGKSAQLPFSAWLSAAMQGPSPVSALLHSATMVAAGGYLLLRLGDLLAATEWAAVAAAWAGALTALVLGVVACAQRDLKQLLAASTAAQIGFVVLAAGVGATTGGLAHLVAHAGVKAALFVAAGAWLTSLGTKQLTGLRGAARRHRGVGACAVVAAAALAGVPPLSLWATKDEVLAGVDHPALHVVALVAAGLSAAYAAKIVVVVLAEPAADGALDVEEPGTRTVPRTTLLPAALLAAAGAALGVVALPVVADGLREIVGGPAAPAPTVVDLALSAVIAIAVAALVLRRPGLLERLEQTPLASWAGMPRLLDGRPVLALAGRLARWDDAVVDRAVMSVPRAIRRAATGLDRHGESMVDRGVEGVAALTAGAGARAAADDVHGVDGLVRAFARGAARLGAASRRPQTGLLHQYYAQAVVGLGVLFAVLLLVR